MRQMSMKLITIVQKKTGMRWLKKTSQQNLKKENTHDTNENTYQRDGDKDEHLTHKNAATTNGGRHEPEQKNRHARGSAVSHFDRDIHRQQCADHTAAGLPQLPGRCRRPLTAHDRGDADRAHRRDRHRRHRARPVSNPETAASGARSWLRRHEDCGTRHSCRRFWSRWAFAGESECNGDKWGE